MYSTLCIINYAGKHEIERKSSLVPRGCSHESKTCLSVPQLKMKLNVNEILTLPKSAVGCMLTEGEGRPPCLGLPGCPLPSRSSAHNAHSVESANSEVDTKTKKVITEISQLFN